MTTAPNRDLLAESSVEEFYAYGFAQYNAGNWEEALDVFKVLCTRRPLEARFWFGLAATCQETRNYLDALHAWAMVALLGKDDPYPHFHAAECYFSLEERGDAFKALQEAHCRITEGHPLQEKILLLKEQWKI